MDEFLCNWVVLKNFQTIIQNSEGIRENKDKFYYIKI